MKGHPGIHEFPKLGDNGLVDVSSVWVNLAAKRNEIAVEYDGFDNIP